MGPLRRQCRMTSRNWTTAFRCGADEPGRDEPREASNAEIAEHLFMSHGTAKTHVSRLLTKLDARDRAQLVMLAYEAGVVVPRSR